MIDELDKSQRKILVADDSFESRQLLSRLLAKLTEAEIHDARDGLAAVQKYRKLRPHITFLDIDMPGRNGIEVLKDIRADDPLAYVVMVTGHGVVAKVQEAVALGIGGFVVKPYTTQRIVDVLRKYVTETGHAEMLLAD